MEPPAPGPVGPAQRADRTPHKPVRLGGLQCSSSKTQYSRLPSTCLNIVHRNEVARHVGVQLAGVDLLYEEVGVGQLGLQPPGQGGEVVLAHQVSLQTSGAVRRCRVSRVVKRLTRTLVAEYCVK